MKYALISGLTFLALMGAWAQEEESDTASTQILNASAVPWVTISRTGDVNYGEVPQGAQISGGATSGRQWILSITPPTPSQPIEAKLERESRGNYAAVVVGDFLEIDSPNEELSERPGFTALPEGKFLRAGVVTTKIAGQRNQRYPFYVLNALPEDKLRLGFEGESVRELSYGETISSGMTASGPKLIKAQHREAQFDLKFHVQSHERGLMLVFFPDANTGKAKYAVVRLQSLDALEGDEDDDPQPSSLEES